MFEKLCRLCATLKDDVINIFDGTSTMQKIQWQLYSVLHIRIQPNDILPTGICTSCVINLQRASDFINYCHSVQKTLKQQYEAYITSCNVTSYGISLKHSTAAAESNFSNVSYPFDELVNPRNTRSVINEICYPREYLPFCQPETESNLRSDPNNFQRNFSPRGRKGNLLEPETDLQEKCAKFNDNEHIVVHAPDLLECSLKNDDGHLQNQNYATDEQGHINLSDVNNEETPEQPDDGRSLPPPSTDASCPSTSDDLQKSKDAVHFFTINDMTDVGSRKEKEKLNCTVCNKTFTLKIAYEEHLNVHTGNRPFVCKICESTFRKRQELNQHLRTIHSEKQFKCSLCSYVAKHKGKLTEHMKSIHEKPFRCSMCSYRTGEKAKIVQHIANKHTTDLSFVCEICGSGFKTKTSLQTHQQNIHFPQPKVCQTCGIVCPSLSKYSAHIFRCGKEKQRYSCEVCGQTYVNKEILKDHMNKHLNIKPYKCEVCGKEFFQRNRLDTHKYVHREPSYHCEVCSQSFNRKDNMKNHIKKHFYKSVTCDNTIVTAV